MKKKYCKRDAIEEEEKINPKHEKEIAFFR
jgi:hypothetical protein